MLGLINEAILPAESPKLATCAGDPLYVIDLIALGVTHVASDFPARCASNGQAITFSINAEVPFIFRRAVLY